MRGSFNSFPKERNTNVALAVKHSSSSDDFYAHKFTVSTEICTALIITFFFSNETNQPIFLLCHISIEPNVVLFHKEDTQIKYFLLINKRRERFLENEIIGNLSENFSLEF